MKNLYTPFKSKPLQKAGIAGLLLLFFMAATFTSTEMQAQNQPAPTVQLSMEQLKACEGVFQNPRNTDMYAQFMVKGNGLIVKMLWNNTEMPLTPESDSLFAIHSEEEGPDHIKFVKDASGQVTKISLGRNEYWSKVNNYKPVVRTELKHNPEQLKPFEGLYQLQGRRPRYLNMTVKDNGLVMKQHWDGTEIPMLPETELDFFSPGAPLFYCSFTRDSVGMITQALLFKRDKWDKLKKPALTTEQLKTLEGKYQFKDDPDNVIQLTARNNKLVLKQLWDKKEIVLDPQTETYFYNNEQSYPLQVIKDKDGNPTQVLLLGMDLFEKVKN